MKQYTKTVNGFELVIKEENDIQDISCAWTGKFLIVLPAVLAEGMLQDYLNDPYEIAAVIVEYAEKYPERCNKGFEKYETHLKGLIKAGQQLTPEEEYVEDNNPWIQNAKEKYAAADNDPELKAAFDEAKIDWAQAELGFSGQHPETIENIQKIWRKIMQDRGAKAYEEKKKKAEELKEKEENAIKSLTGNFKKIVLEVDESILPYVQKTIGDLVRKGNNTIKKMTQSKTKGIKWTKSS